MAGMWSSWLGFALPVGLPLFFQRGKPWRIVNPFLPWLFMARILLLVFVKEMVPGEFSSGVNFICLEGRWILWMSSVLA